MTSLKLLLGGLLFTASALLSVGCTSNPVKDCSSDGTCPTLCDTCTIPSSCGIACTNTPKCPTCNVNPNPGTASFTCDISTDNGATYNPFVGKVMKGWIFKDPNPAIPSKYIVLHVQAYDAMNAVNDQICVSIKKTVTGIYNYSLSPGSDSAAFAYIPKTGTPYSTYSGNSGTGKFNLTTINTTDSTFTGTFTDPIKPFPTRFVSSSTTVRIKNGVFKNIKFTNWIKGSTLTAKIDGASWTPGGIVRAHPGGEPKNAHKLVIEAPFLLNAGQTQKMILKMPLNIATNSSGYILDIAGSSANGDYNINFTDNIGTGYTLKSPGTSLNQFTNISHNANARSISSSNSTMTMTAGTTTKLISFCNFNARY